MSPQRLVLPGVICLGLGRRMSSEAGLVTRGLLPNSVAPSPPNAASAAVRPLDEIPARPRRVDGACWLTRRCRTGIAATMGLLLLLLHQGAALAGTSVSITLMGAVPPRSALRLAEGSPVPTIDLRQPVRGAPLGSFIDETSTPSGYSLVLVSQNAARLGGQPRLIAANDDAAIPYTLSFAGKEVRFNGAEAVLAGAASPHAGARPSALAVSTTAAAAPMTQYQDVLSVIVRAN